MSLGTCKFVSKKVSRVRWQPCLDTSNTDTNCLATGSWDDEQNCVSVFRCVPSAEGGAGTVAEVCSTPVNGDVTGLEWLDRNNLLAATSKGSLQLYSWQHVAEPQLGGCTALAAHTSSRTLATGAEDGRLCVSSLATGGQPGEQRRYSVAGDQSSITALSLSRAWELVSANLRGQLRLWDLRLPPPQAMSTSCSSAQAHGGVTCLARHPAQTHVLVAGCGDGVVGVWDLRSPQHPTTLLSAHGAPLGEVIFHPLLPDSLLSCSQGGDVCHWRTGASGHQDSVQDILKDSISTATTSPWLNSEAVKNKVETHSLVTKQPLPVNSLDVVGSSVVFGGDNEAFYVLHKVLF